MAPDKAFLQVFRTCCLLGVHRHAEAAAPVLRQHRARRGSLQTRPFWSGARFRPEPVLATDRRFYYRLAPRMDLFQAELAPRMDLIWLSGWSENDIREWETEQCVVAFV